MYAHLDSFTTSPYLGCARGSDLRPAYAPLLGAPNRPGHSNLGFTYLNLGPTYLHSSQAPKAVLGPFQNVLGLPGGFLEALKPRKMHCFYGFLHHFAVLVQRRLGDRPDGLQEPPREPK